MSHIFVIFTKYSDTGVFFLVTANTDTHVRSTQVISTLRMFQEDEYMDIFKCLNGMYFATGPTQICQT